MLNLRKKVLLKIRLGHSYPSEPQFTQKKTVLAVWFQFGRHSVQQLLRQ